MSEDYNSINIDENYELLPNINNRKKKLLKKILLLLIVVAVIILLIISTHPLIGKKSYNKNLVFLVQDVSNSLQNFYNTDNLLIEQYLDYDSLMNFIDGHSYFNKTDIYACLSGTQPEKSYDLLSMLKDTELINNINTETYESMVDNIYDQIRNSISDPDNEIKNSLKDYNLKLDNFLKQSDKKQKTALAYYLKDDVFLRKQVADDLEIQIKKDKCSFLWWFCYDYVFPKELLKKKLREDKVRIFLKKNINFEKHKTYEKYSLATIYNIIQETKRNILKQIDNINVFDFLSIFKDNVFGKSYLVDTLTKVKKELIKNDYKNKILLLVTDGKSTDGNIRNVAEEIKKETNTYIVVFCISSHELNRPKELFINPPSNLYDYEKVLFEASSSLNSNLELFSYLRQKGITVQNEGQTKLFFQTNDKSLIKILFESLQNLFNHHDVLFDLIGRVELKNYVGSSMDAFSVRNQGNEGTCYAFASATAIHLTLVRLKGNKSPPFEGIKDYLVERYGIKGYNVPKLLNAELGKYKLRYRKVNEKEAREAILKKRICVMTFYFTFYELAQFETFFYDLEPQGILTKEKMNEIIPNKNYLPENITEYEETGGHAVVLVGSQVEYLKFLNSWGTRFGDKGFFKLKNSEIFKMYFYELYWDDNDLTKEELEEHYKFKKELSAEYFEDVKNYEKISNTEFECPLCHAKSTIKEFNGFIDEVKCPKCKKMFTTTDETLLKKLYFDFVNL